MLVRLRNEEADALTNSDFGHFKMASRIGVYLTTLFFVLLNSLFAEGDAYVKELEVLKAQEAARVQGGGGRWPKRRKPEGGSLRERDPGPSLC